MILDITEPEQMATVARRIAADPARRPLRVMVNNAGVAVNAPVALLSTADWRERFEADFFGHVAVTKAVLPALHESFRPLVNIGSVGGRVALPAYGAYTGAKFAMEAMTDSLRRERRRTASGSWPRTGYTVGRDAAVLTRPARLLPDAAPARVLAAAFGPTSGVRAAPDERAVGLSKRTRYHQFRPLPQKTSDDHVFPQCGHYLPGGFR